MQNDFIILCENTCDLPADYIKKNSIEILPLTFSLDEREYDGTFENMIGLTDFYNALRNGAVSKTAQVAPDSVYKLYKELLSAGKGILHICFSSGLSGTYQSSVIALSNIKEEMPDAPIYCIDSLAASLGHGLLIDYAVRQRSEGASLEAAAKAVEDIKQSLCHYFTVDDLHFLHRGGRVSKTAAVFGTMLGIKPVLHVDEEGRLIPIGKVRGRKQSLDALVDKMESKLSSYKNPYVFISHGDSAEDAQYVAGLVKKRFGIKTEIINYVGPVIGAHSGPGTIALFFFGKDRFEKKA